MDETFGGARCVRSLQVEGAALQAIEAWRGRCGHTLVYFLPDDSRALLPPGRTLEGLRSAELAALWREAVHLTGTERRLAGAGDRLWLAQSSGPVWAGAEVSDSLAGVVVTSLSGPFERHVLEGASVAGVDDPRLVTVVAEASATSSSSSSSSSSA